MVGRHRRSQEAGRASIPVSTLFPSRLLYTCPRQGFQCLVPDLYKGTLGVTVEEANHSMSNLDFPAAVDEICQAAAHLQVCPLTICIHAGIYCCRSTSVVWSLLLIAGHLPLN